MIGIYEIVHTPGGRAYIGSSVDTDRRLKAHRDMLRRGASDNIWLQRTWDRDGEAAFVFRAIERCSLESLRDIEAETIATRGKDRLFNFSEVVRRGARGSGSALTDEQALALYREAAAGESANVLAKKYGCAQWTAVRIILGYTYAHVTGGKRARPPVKASGERINGTLTEAQARDIFDRSQRGEHPKHIAASYGITYQAVIAIRDRRVWKRLHASPPLAS